MRHHPESNLANVQEETRASAGPRQQLGPTIGGAPSAHEQLTQHSTTRIFGVKLGVNMFDPPNPNRPHYSPSQPEPPSRNISDYSKNARKPESLDI